MAKKPPATGKKTKRKGRKPTPKCKAILLCDRAIKDQFTDTITLVGILTQFNLPTFPGTTCRFTAFLQLTDGFGDYDLTVEIHDLNREVVIARVRGAKFHLKDQRETKDFIMGLPELPLPHRGVYDFVVFADGHEIDRQLFTAEGASDDDGEETEGVENQ